MKKINNRIYVSVIIATYNASKNLEKAIESVLNQSYSYMELIVIDGGSTDNTTNILKKYDTSLKYISEKDDGIGDAFNKGIKLSSGDFIYFLGADDFLLDTKVVEKIMEGVNQQDLIICGKIKRVDISGVKTLWIAPKTLGFKRCSLLFRMSLPHQGLFMNKKFFNEYGLFDTNNKYSMDYELLLRAYNNFPKIIMKDILVAAWREGGIGNELTLKVYDEYKEIKIKNKVASKFTIIGVDYYNRFKYHVKSIFNRRRNVRE